MNNQDMKNIIILKDLPSNIIDEAIVILKSSINIKKKVKIMNNQDENINDCIISEAQEIITNYIEQAEKKKIEKRNEKKINFKYKRLQILTILLGILFIVSLLICLIK